MRSLEEENAVNLGSRSHGVEMGLSVKPILRLNKVHLLVYTVYCVAVCFSCTLVRTVHFW